MDRETDRLRVASQGLSWEFSKFSFARILLLGLLRVAPTNPRWVSEDGLVKKVA